MKDSGNPSRASSDGRNGSRPASTYRGTEYTDSASAPPRRIGGTHMPLVIAAGRQVGLGWGGNSVQLVGKSDSRRQGFARRGRAAPRARAWLYSLQFPAHNPRSMKEGGW